MGANLDGQPVLLDDQQVMLGGDAVADSPSEWSDWVVTNISSEPGEGVASEWSAWVVTSTDAEAGGSSPSPWSEWVVTQTSGPQLNEWWVVDDGELVRARMFTAEELDAEPPDDD